MPKKRDPKEANCTECGVRFVRNHAARKRCGARECELAAGRKRSHRYNRKHGHVKAPIGTVLQCPECDDSFTKMAATQKYCSAPCTEGAMPKRKRLEKARRKYGLTEEEYDALVERQGGCCAMCGLPEEEHGAYLCIDHCHGSGEVRGLLCRNCNSGIGKLGDKLEGVLNACLYLMTTTPDARSVAVDTAPERLISDVVALLSVAQRRTRPGVRRTGIDYGGA